MSGDLDGYPLTSEESSKLATFNSEVSRGLVHRPGYAFEMAKLQEKYNAWILTLNEESGYNAWAAAQPKSVRVSSTSPYVTGGASASQAELDQVSEEIRTAGEEIDANYRKDLAEDAPSGPRRDPSADAMAATWESASASATDRAGHTHSFDRLHGLCRCGEGPAEA